ncbi:hypothetical protein Tco_1211789 [Tanacetum coccineum]
MRHCLVWFISKDFPQDSAVDGVDDDMILETLLNDPPTRIRRYPEEFLVLIGLSRLWYAPMARPAFYNENDEVSNPFDVVCGEEKLLENERHVLERTADVVTSPFDEIVNLDHGVCFKVGKGYKEYSSGVVAAGESASKADDVGIDSGETPSPLLFDDPPPTTSFKAGEFVPASSTAPLKQLLEDSELVKDKLQRREMDRLRLGFEATEREVGRLRSQVDKLKVEAGKVPGLLASYSQKETELSTINVRWDAGCPTKKRFDELVAALDERLDKMVKETDEELALILRDPIHTKKWIIEQARIVHGKKRIDINSIPAYNLNAAEVYTDALNSLNDMPFPFLEQLEVCAGVQFSYIEALLVMGAYEPKQDGAGTSTNLVSGSTSFAAKTVSDTAAHVTLASAPDVSASGPSTLVIPEDSPPTWGLAFQCLLSCKLHCFAIAAISLFSSKISKFRRSPSSFLLLTMEHLRDDITISTGITASMPYVSENGLFSFYDLIMLACSGPTHLIHGLRNDFRYKVPSSMTYCLTLAFSRCAFPYYSGSVAFSRYSLIGFIHASHSSSTIAITSLPSTGLHDSTSTSIASWFLLLLRSQQGIGLVLRFKGSLRFIHSSKVTFLKQRFRVLKNGNYFFASLDMHLMKLASFMFKLCTSFNVWGDGMFITTWAFSLQA